MQINKIWATYFSATGTAEKVVGSLADEISANLGLDKDSFDFTLPAARKQERHFSEKDLVILGIPVIAGRVPNVLLKYLATIAGHNALGIPVCVYGNRNFDDALIELRDIMEKGGFRIAAAAAFIGEHSFSTILGAGRPDDSDMKTVKIFAARVAQKLLDMTGRDKLAPLAVKGTPYPYRGYYQPRDRQGHPVDIRKVKPLTNAALCTDCKICAEVCPMGSIDFNDVNIYNGICIKCCACIKKCPVNAKYYDDPGYLYHKQELEEEFMRRAEPDLFI